MLLTHDEDRVRTLTMNRPEALNAFNGQMWDALTDGLIDARDDPAVAVVLLTGAGRAYSAGADLVDMAAGNDGSRRAYTSRHGMNGFLDVLMDYPKPLIMAVNGVAVGIGATMLGYADLVFMSATARIRCPFTSLGLAPEASSSLTFTRLLGRQNAAWVLLSSEFFSAAECKEMGLAWKVCEPEDLLPVALSYAKKLAAQPVSSLMETKRLIAGPLKDRIVEVRDLENAALARGLGSPANREALAAFKEKRPPDFTKLPPGS
jgi:enoyl-CoA hydratase/carnithine racemase